MPGTHNQQRLLAIAEQFELEGPISAIREMGNGNVNDTYLVSLAGGEAGQVVLQRVNTNVFKRPEMVMGNMLIFSEHVGRKMASLDPHLKHRRWEVPRILRARGSDAPWVATEGEFWRALSFIDSAQSFDTISSTCQAREVGYGLGMFHGLISDLPADALSDTLEDFHVTPGYLSHYQRVLATCTIPSGEAIEYCRAFVNQRLELVHVLESEKQEGRLPLRPIHGDPKINNIMMDVNTGQAIALVDLDTVKPGLVHYDIGDCLRSGCNRLGEDTQDLHSVGFDTDICRAILEGYCSVARSFLTCNDYAYIYASIRVISFELGLRFFTDYLAGSMYFKSSYPAQNLNRALVQFRLTESIEAQQDEIQTIVAALR